MLRILPGVLSGLAGLLLGLGAYTFHFAEGLSYLSGDPEACAHCHVMREYVDRWRKSGRHTGIACQDCHGRARAENAWRHSVRFTLGSFADPIHLRADNAGRVRANCVQCHGQLVEGIHGQDLDCLHCHAGAGHATRSGL